MTVTHSSGDSYSVEFSGLAHMYKSVPVCISDCQYQVSDNEVLRVQLGQDLFNDLLELIYN